ncbi:HAMP domain-containing sensor histidine kinase [Cysteiniphilum sp. QT6929]|uniref:sensor histidine kinase n=1 Tax=Cysteiniphilum sp. QT6929 TaxID=2975055 RepID=UPI0024B36DD8|nr:HAMP domain-containing sensor histidine kinase [Cysteiniphilum sp. QT6929]WHN66265.1 HAMP domain-containing histidine kinase [Cysteiniphilum sp. QT6929]
MSFLLMWLKKVKQLKIRIYSSWFSIVLAIISVLLFSQIVITSMHYYIELKSNRVANVLYYLSNLEYFDFDRMEKENLRKSLPKLSNSMVSIAMEKKKPLDLDYVHPEGALTKEQIETILPEINFFRSWRIGVYVEELKTWVLLDIHPVNFPWKLIIFIFIQALLVIILMSYYWNVYQLKKAWKRVHNLYQKSMSFNDKSDTDIPITSAAIIKMAVKDLETLIKRVDSLSNEKIHMMMSLAHGIRTPLMKMNVALYKVDNSEAVDKLEALISEIDEILSQIIQYTKSEQGSAAKQTTNLAKLTQQIFEQYATAVPSFSIVTLSNKAFVTSINKVSFELALNNLVDNGIKYGKQVEVSTYQDKGHFYIAIQDYGPGIDHKDMHKVFEPFQRVMNEKHGSIRGSGVGLAIVKKMLEEHQAEIRLENNQKGLKVSLCF